MRLRFCTTLIALALGAVATACGSLQPLPVRTGSASPTPSNSTAAASATQSATATATPAVPLVLSRSFAGLKLGMTEQEILAVLGEPAVRTRQPTAGNPEWRYTGGLTLELSVASEPPSLLYEIQARTPFAGKTAEGFGLGDSPSDFRRVYGRLDISDENATPPDFSHYMRAKDVAGTTVLAQFSRDERAITVVVYASR